MTVTSADPIHSGWTGATAYGQTVYDFDVMYVVKTNDREDGPDTVIDYITTNVADLGDGYVLGNDSHIGAKLKSIKPTPMGGKVWSVKLTYGDPSKDNQSNDDSDQQGLDENNNPSTEICNDAESIQVFHVKRTKAAINGVFIGSNADAQGGLFHGNVGKTIAIQNSAEVPFSPPFEMDDSRLALRVRKFYQVFPVLHLTYQNNVNNDLFGIGRPWGFNMLFAEYTVKMENITGDYRIRNNVGCWVVDYEMHIEPETWRPQFLDIGFSQRQKPGDQDALSGTQIVDANKPNAAIVDGRGIPTQEPVKLNGEGQLLPEGEPSDGSDGVYLRYAVYPEKQFFFLNL